jgi:hypothetical protein
MKPLTGSAWPPRADKPPFPIGRTCRQTRMTRWCAVAIRPERCPKIFTLQVTRNSIGSRCLAPAQRHAGLDQETLERLVRDRSSQESVALETFNTKLAADRYRVFQSGSNRNQRRVKNHRENPTEKGCVRKSIYATTSLTSSGLRLGKPDSLGNQACHDNASRVDHLPQLVRCRTTRRLCARPSAVLLSATGFASPYPLTASRCVAIPLLAR